jgi:hypothetical protein
MSMQGAYFRYVDDIRILGKTELEVRKALVSLDILCKSIGLIPHSDKTSIRQVYSANELIEDIPEIKHYFEDEGSQTVSKQYAEKYILDAVNLNGKITVQDKTLLRYLLFRVPASDKILRIVLKIWEHFPEHTDAYVAFLENYQRDDEVISLSNRLLMDGYPYDYVQGELWKLLARMCTPSELEGIKELAIQTIKNSKSGHSSRLGAQIFLCKCDSSGLGDYEKWLIYEKKALIQALVAPHLTLQSVSGRLAGKAMLTRSTADSYLALLKPIIDAGLQLSDFRRDPAEFPFVAQYVYKAAGLSGHQIPRADAIGNLLIKRFSVKNWNKWKQLFQGEYRHAHMILKFADTYYDSHMSTWLNYQDTFNEILFMVFQDFLSTKNAPGVINLTDKNKKRIPYGILLRTPTLKIAYPNLSDDLIRIHNRRNKLPGSHAYDEKTGDKSRPLKKREQLTLKSYIDDALEEIIRIVESFGI